MGNHRIQLYDCIRRGKGIVICWCNSYWNIEKGTKYKLEKKRMMRDKHITVNDRNNLKVVKNEVAEFFIFKTHQFSNLKIIKY